MDGVAQDLYGSAINAKARFALVRAFTTRRARGEHMRCHLALCALLGALSACGGGGGGGGNSNSVSTTGQSSGSFTISATSVTYSGTQNGVVPSSQTLTIQVTGSNVAYVGAAYSGGQTQPSWLAFSISGSGNTWQLVLSITSTDLVPGQYTSTFDVGTADSNQNILAYQAVTVTYTVAPGVAITSQSYSATFTDGGSKTTDSVSVGVTAPGLQWHATSDSSWLTVPTGAQSGTGSLQATVNVAGLSPGTYQGHVTVTDSSAASSATLAFSIAVQAPTLVVTPTSLVLGGANGISNNAPQSLAFALGTDTVAHPFTVTLQTTSGGNWLTANVTSGTVNAAGATIQISGNRTGLAAATYTGQVQIAATVGSLVVTAQVPVTFNVEANRIVVGASGVGLSSSPAGSVLTRNVTVFSAVGLTNTPWQASSDQSWLTVTPSGVTGGAVTLTAATSGLSTDTPYFANVTVTSPDASVDNQETIRVGLYISSLAPTAVSQAVGALFVTTSPVEPIAFVSGGGTGVTGYNVYTGVVDRTFASVVAQAGQMVVSGDGKYLFVYDAGNQQVTQLDATSGSVIQNFPSSGAGLNSALAYVRPNGHAMLITPSWRAYEVTNATEYDSATGSGNVGALSLAASPDQSMLIDSSGTVYSIARSELNGGKFYVALLFQATIVDPEAHVGQTCISDDGQTAYGASGAPYEFQSVSLATRLAAPALPGKPYPNAIVCVWNGLVVGGMDDGIDSTDVYVYYGPTAALLAMMDSSAVTTGPRELLDRGLAVSADGTRLVTLVSTNPTSNIGAELRFQSLPAPP